MARWLVDSTIPTLQPEQANRDALHGGLRKAAPEPLSRWSKRSRGLPRMLTQFKLSILWLQHRLGVWPRVDMRGLRHTGEGCLSPRWLAYVADMPG